MPRCTGRSRVGGIVSSGPDALSTSRRDRTDAILVGSVIIVGGLALMLVQKRWAYHFQLIAHDRYFWATMLLVLIGATAAAEAAWRLLLQRTCNLALLLGFAATVAAGHVFYPIANGAFDRRPAEQRAYVVEQRYCHGTRETVGYATMWLRPVAAPDRGVFRLRVPRRSCRSAQDGQELLLDVKPGFIGSAWVDYDSARQR